MKTVGIIIKDARIRKKLTLAEVEKATKKAEFEDSKKAVKKVKDNQEKTTLGDISALSDLRDKLDGKK